jgi:hypothetical protein
MPTGKRADDATSITFSCKKWLADRLKEWAEEEGRSRSNLIIKLLREAVETREQQAIIAGASRPYGWGIICRGSTSRRCSPPYAGPEEKGPRIVKLEQMPIDQPKPA